MIIDAEEHRDVATVDIPGAFMHSDVDELIHVRLEGKMAELLVKIDPELYGPHLQDVNGKSVLYVELLKALYGTVKAAIFFWNLLSKQLQEWNFKLYPYDACVANKIINGKQCTIVWHVDDLKILHVDPKVVDQVIADIDKVYGKLSPVTTNRGKTHDYLGMTLDYSIPGKAQINMKDYITNILNTTI